MLLAHIMGIPVEETLVPMASMTSMMLLGIIGYGCRTIHARCFRR
jgi:hypothetical protein